MSAATTTTTTRNATLADLAAMLQDQHGRKVDVVAPASTLQMIGGQLVVAGSEVQLNDDGVTTIDGHYRPTDVFDEGLSDKLGIDLRYLRKLRTSAVDLYDANVNGWLHGYPPAGRHAADDPCPTRAGDSRSFLVRAFRGDDGPGIARAMLSDRYSVIDHLDVLTAALDGIKAAGVEVEIARCDLSDRRMYVAVSCPAVSALAPELLAGYRSPFNGNTGTDNPVVFGGFVFANSETGNGAYSITPRLIVQACTNGVTINVDAMREIHVGQRMEEGIIRWSEDTTRKSIALVTAKTRDAVATFLDVDYVKAQLAKLTAKAGAPVVEPAKAIAAVGKKLAFSEAQTSLILDHFIRGGQMTAGGVLQAITSAAQLQESADAQYDMEAAAIKAMELVAVS